MSAPSPRDPQRALDALRSLLRRLGSVLVCYSGGIDSALLLAVATRELGENAVGMTALSPSLSASEREDASRTAQALGARHELVESRELQRPGYVANGPDRCFHCKTELYTLAESQRLAWGLAHVVNGTNLDDLGDYRPGLEAARLAGVRSPFVELGFDKQTVREVAQLLGLELWNKPAAACLASRIPYGTSVTPERLSQIEGLESDLRALGFRQLRVRWQERMARIELALDEVPRAVQPALREAIVSAGKARGFTYVTLDLGGYRQGSHNEALATRGEGHGAGQRSLPVL